MAILITLDQLILAYRKAKYEVYHETNPSLKMLFADYEQNLISNLENLMVRINSNGKDLVKDIDFLGTFSWVLKEVAINNPLGDDSSFLYHSNQFKIWQMPNVTADIDFRFVGQLSVDFHVLGSLWIDVVGHKMEAKIGETSYGCRLLRPKQKMDRFIPEYFSYDEIAPDKLQKGHFRFYVNDYKRWQHDGISAIKNAIKANKNVIVITSDVEKYYHRVSPEFIARKDFHKAIGVELNENERLLNNLVVDAIKNWSSQIINASNGVSDIVISKYNLPVGWAASKVIANLLLHHFDNQVAGELMPIFYGRYVDDIFIAIEDNKQFANKEQIWEFIEKRIPFLQYNKESGYKNYFIPWSQESIIKFAEKKERIFILEGTSGEEFVDKVKESLDENTSEWRLLPESEDSIVKMVDGIVSPSSDFSEELNGLRQSDGISIKRLKFILHLRNFETMIDTLPKNIWSSGINKFFRFCIDFIITPDQLPNFCQYHPRLISMFVKAKKYKDVVEMLNRINESWRILFDCTNDEETRNKLNNAHTLNRKILSEAFIKGRRRTGLQKWRPV